MPTDAELAILQVLWKRGPSTVRVVHETLEGEREVGYTTVLKFLQIMTEKGLVTRDTAQRAHVYAPAVDEQQVQQHMVTDLLGRAFGGSAEKLILRVLSAKGSTSDEFAEIRRLLDDIEENR